MAVLMDLSADMLRERISIGDLLGLPVPLGDVLPALAISLLALGVLERDGVWVLAGIAVAGAAVSVVSGVVFALVKAGVHFFVQAVS